MRLTNQTKRKPRREDLMKYLNLENDLPVSRLYDVITVSDASFLEDDYGCHMGYAILIVIKDTIEIPGERPYKGYHVFYTSGYGTEAALSWEAEQIAIVEAARVVADLLRYHCEVKRDSAPSVLMLTDYISFCGTVSFYGTVANGRYPSSGNYGSSSQGEETRYIIRQLLRRCHVQVSYANVRRCKALAIVDAFSKSIRLAGWMGRVSKRLGLARRNWATQEQAGENDLQYEEACLMG